MGGELQLRVEPASGRFIPDDERWLTQVTALVTELRAGLDGVSVEGEPVPGTKGTASAIAVSIAAAGGVTALIDLLRSWMTRDQTRSVKVALGEGRERIEVELSSDGLDQARLDDLLRAVTERVAEGG